MSHADDSGVIAARLVDCMVGPSGVRRFSDYIDCHFRYYAAAATDSAVATVENQAHRIDRPRAIMDLHAGDFSQCRPEHPC